MLTTWEHEVGPPASKAQAGKLNSVILPRFGVRAESIVALQNHNQNDEIRTQGSVLSAPDRFRNDFASHDSAFFASWRLGVRFLPTPGIRPLRGADELAPAFWTAVTESAKSPLWLERPQNAPVGRAESHAKTQRRKGPRMMLLHLNSASGLRRRLSPQWQNHGWQNDEIRTWGLPRSGPDRFRNDFASHDSAFFAPWRLGVRDLP